MLEWSIWTIWISKWAVGIKMSELMKQTLTLTGMEIEIASDGQIKGLLCDAIFDIIVGMLDNEIELSHYSYSLISILELISTY